MKERSEAKRAEILRRAAAVFREKGFHRAGMREIARGLGVAPGVLYYYFENKEELLYACQMLSLRRLLESVGRIIAAEATPEERLARLVRAHLGHVLGELGGSFAHIEFHALPEPRLSEVVSKRDEYEAMVRGIIAEGVAARRFRKVDVKLTALALLGALNWTVVWWRPEGNGNLDRVASEIADTFLLGLRS